MFVLSAANEAMRTMVGALRGLSHSLRLRKCYILGDIMEGKGKHVVHPVNIAHQ